MSIYSAHTVSERPEIYLECWSIRETSAGNLHLVGFNIEDRDGRVSSRIVELDCARRIGATLTGRRYFLVGRAGYNSDAEYVWNWCVRNWNIESWKDVTADLIPDWRRGVAHVPGSEDSANDFRASLDGGPNDDAK